ncbi:MAG TPA: methionine--tRNA ligase [Thermoanaerobaculia bacterium]|nr:methionine--tRNA ligase [Thermoanaerobaculia bacterium]
MASRYFTTPIYYVNDRPHIGHLYTTVVTDALARYWRLRGEDVRMLTGTDEHGQNIEKVARKEGVAPIVIADRHAPTFQNLWKTFGVANDDFIRTTEPRHRKGVEEIIRRLDAAGDLYTAAHEGWYCPPCEAFYPEKDLTDGKCPVHGTTLELQKEENVFFRLSKYGDRLLKLYDEGVGGRPFVFPDSRLNEVRSFVAAGLKDLSVSRTSITWGLPFPGRPGHVVYVWLDALVNYVTALGFGSSDLSLYERYWPGIHVIGKDILRFHAVYWPAFLMSAGMPVPRQIVGHGWWLRDARKMSKSVGNVVRPDELVEAFGVDALRWHFVAAMSFGQDANFSDEDFLSGYNADLANGLGNTLSRAVKMSRDFFGGTTPPSKRVTFVQAGPLLYSAAEKAVRDWKAAFEGYRLQDAAAAIRGLLGAIDAEITATEPWKIMKAEGPSQRLSHVLYDCLEALRTAACLLAPVAPRTATEVLRRLGVDMRAEDVRDSDLAWGGLPTGAPLPVAPPLFPRADAKEYFASRGAATGSANKESSVASDNVKEDSSKGPSPFVTAPLATQPTPDAGVLSPSKQNPSLPSAPSQQATTPASPVGEGAKIPIDDFLKLDLRVGEVIAAEKVEKSKKLMKMTVKIGEEVRTIVGGIAAAYTPEQLVGRKFVFVANLAPAKLMGVESNGMILAATLPETGAPSLLMVDPAVPSGAKVK